MLTILEYLEIKNYLLKELSYSNTRADRKQVLIETLEAIDMKIGVQHVA